MGNIAVIKDTIVVNVVAVEDDTRASTRAFWVDQGYTCVDDAKCGPGDSYVNGQFIPAPIPVPVPTWVITRNAFQNRFPVTANGVSTKYDLMTLFLTDTAYAESLGVTGSAIFDLRSIIITGNNRLGVVTEVNLQSQETINYVNMTTNVLFPDAFRLTTAEASAILTTPAATNEIP